MQTVQNVCPQFIRAGCIMISKQILHLTLSFNNANLVATALTEGYFFMAPILAPLLLDLSIPAAIIWSKLCITLWGQLSEEDIYNIIFVMNNNDQIYGSLDFKSTRH